MLDNAWGNLNHITASAVGGTHWAATFNTGETHTFTVTLDAESAGDLDLHIVAVDADNNTSEKLNGSFSAIAVNNINTTSTKTLTLEVTNDYAAVYLYSTSDGSKKKTYKITSITRTVTSGGGGGGSALDGKTAVTYNIPGKNVIFSDSFGSNIDNWGKWNEENGSVSWDSTTGHDSNGCMKVVNNESRPSDQWRIQRHADFPQISSGTTFFVTFYIKCESGTGSIRCSTTPTDHAQYQGDQNVTTEWQKIVWEVTAEDNIDGLCLDMAHTANTYYIDDVEVYTNADTGGSNVFTSDDQVANISSSAFSSLAEGDYICADVTGTPETIKLICNGSDYALTQFNGSNLWGIMATADMVTALQANNSQFKGHDLTLNGINIYKTVALGEGANEISLYNNVFVELTRSFVADNWNTVCLPFVPTSAQANTLFGSGYKLAEFTGVSGTGTTMQFTTIDIAAFEAGKPYLVMPKTGCATGATVLSDVNITAKDPTPVTFGNYTFTGTFTTKTFSGDDECNTSRFVATGNELQKPNNSSTLKSLRCYFTVPAAAARSLSFDVDEEGNTTGVADINRETITNNGDFFNLAGQRVAQPTKGLYIVNGKKVVIK